jgi:hypothetical protein
MPSATVPGQYATIGAILDPPSFCWTPPLKDKKKDLPGMSRIETYRIQHSFWCEYYKFEMCSPGGITTPRKQETDQQRAAFFQLTLVHKNEQVSRLTVEVTFEYKKYSYILPHSKLDQRMYSFALFKASAPTL